MTTGYKLSQCKSTNIDSCAADLGNGSNAMTISRVVCDVADCGLTPV